MPTAENPRVQDEGRHDSTRLGPRDDVQSLSRTECLALLAANSFGRVIVTFGREHRALVRPVNYGFDAPSQSVVFRTAPGTKLHALLHSRSACFEIDAIDATARSGWSVIVYGTAGTVFEPGDIRRLEARGLDSLAPGPRPEWIRVRATTVTGVRISDAPAAG
jgi:nitroimidazol reductase NimA-like FMN-containing flavoprotein (pyridoxamine 5'-phosphate oxidase superfamily)